MMTRKTLGMLGPLAAMAVLSSQSVNSVQVVDDERKIEPKINPIFEKRMKHYRQVIPSGLKRFTFLVGKEEEHHMMITIHANNQKNADKKFNRIVKELDIMIKSKEERKEEVKADDIFEIESKYQYLRIDFKTPKDLDGDSK